LFVVQTKESFVQLPFLHYHGWKANKNPLTFDGVTSEKEEWQTQTDSTRPGQPFVVISFWDQQAGLATWLSDRERYIRQFCALCSWNKSPEDSTPRVAAHRYEIVSLIWY
jgi:hypothetical protein